MRAPLHKYTSTQTLRPWDSSNPAQLVEKFCWWGKMWWSMAGDSTQFQEMPNSVSEIQEHVFECFFWHSQILVLRTGQDTDRQRPADDNHISPHLMFQPNQESVGKWAAPWEQKNPSFFWFSSTTNFSHLQENRSLDTLEILLGGRLIFWNLLCHKSE